MRKITFHPAIVSPPFSPAPFAKDGQPVPLPPLDCIRRRFREEGCRPVPPHPSISADRSLIVTDGL